MNKVLFFTALVSVMLCVSSCGADNSATGAPEDVMSKKDYSKLCITYDDYFDFSEGLCKVRLGSYSEGKFGFINSKGKLVIPCTFELAGQSHDEMIWFKEGDKYGFINRKGDVIVPATYKNVEDFSEGLAVVAIPKDAEHSWDKVYGYVNKKGEVAIPIVYDYAQDFHDGLALVKENKKYGYLDKKGEFAIPANYDDASEFSEGIAFVKKNNKEYAIDTKGEVIFALPKRMSIQGTFHDGLALVEKYGESWSDDDYYGYINKQGEVVIPCKYDDAEDFKNGVAQVEKNDKKFYINTQGEKVEDPE